MSRTWTRSEGSRVIALSGVERVAAGGFERRRRAVLVQMPPNPLPATGQSR